jgi:hypothetical protein
MATKGIPIDFSKKYRTISGLKVKRFEISDVFPTGFPIMAVFADESKKSYTKEGFFITENNTNPQDLILDEDAEKEQAINVSEVFKRKVVQIISVAIQEDNAVYALCDDGKIFVIDNSNKWYELPLIPQD